jgi:hypothetical protein
MACVNCNFFIYLTKKEDPAVIQQRPQQIVGFPIDQEQVLLPPPPILGVYEGIVNSSGHLTPSPYDEAVAHGQAVLMECQSNRSSVFVAQGIE